MGPAAGNKNIKIWSSPGPGFSEIAFNSCPPRVASAGPASSVHKDVVQDQAIRHALYYALNRPEV